VETVGVNIGIVGAGMLGLSLGYLLTRAGVKVSIYEAKSHAGGLLETIEVDGSHIDKYYHCILGTDTDLLALVDELGLNDRVRFASARQGFYSGGRLYPMASAKDLLLFPPLTLVERVRLGLTALAAFRINDWSDLEQIPVEDWLVRLGGRGTFEKVW
jgi:protoporphyrinogen oxidase